LEDIEIIGHLIGNFETFSVVQFWMLYNWRTLVYEVYLLSYCR